MAVVTIRVAPKVKRALGRLKLNPRETYSDLLDRLLEDRRELGAGTMREIELARADIRSGRRMTHDQVRTSLRLG